MMAFSGFFSQLFVRLPGEPCSDSRAILVPIDQRLELFDTGLSVRAVLDPQPGSELKRDLGKIAMDVCVQIRYDMTA